MIAWQIARHQVAIAGWVSDGETGKPVSGAEVTITEMPAAFKKRLQGSALQHGKRWTAMVERPDRTQTRADGLFYFLDLPDGTYTLSASCTSTGKRYGTARETATVSRDGKANIKMASVNFVLRPTTIKGKITGPGHKTVVVMAEVRVKGSGERAFSDAQGQYVLAGIEPGKRTVLVFAQGYRPASQPVTLEHPGALGTLNFALAREGG